MCSSTLISGTASRRVGLVWLYAPVEAKVGCSNATESDRPPRRRATSPVQCRPRVHEPPARRSGLRGSNGSSASDLPASEAGVELTDPLGDKGGASSRAGGLLLPRDRCGPLQARGPFYALFRRKGERSRARPRGASKTLRSSATARPRGRFTPIRVTTAWWPLCCSTDSIRASRGTRFWR